MIANDVCAFRTVEQQQTSRHLRENDLPPKYEDLMHPGGEAGEGSAGGAEASPPLYSEATNRQEEESVTVTVESNVRREQ